MDCLLGRPWREPGLPGHVISDLKCILHCGGMHYKSRSWKGLADGSGPLPTYLHKYTHKYPNMAALGPRARPRPCALSRHFWLCMFIFVYLYVYVCIFVYLYVYKNHKTSKIIASNGNRHVGLFFVQICIESRCGRF